MLNRFWRSWPRLSPSVSVVIPTRDSARHIGIVLDHYRRAGLPVQVFVDAASADDTLAVCRRSGHRTEVIDNPEGRTEAMVAGMSAGAATDWVLRLDDDELPTDAMIRAVNACVAADPRATHAFRLRHCCLAAGGGLAAVRFYEDPPHDQLRLYHRRHVRFDTGLHSPGIDPENRQVAPPDAFFVHLQWIVKSYAERAQKIARYDVQRPGAGSEWRDYYLVEDNAPALATAYRLPAPEFTRAARALARRFPGAVRL